MFSRYYARDQVARYEASPHKPRIDYVAGCLVTRQYLDVVITDHVREWLRLATYCDARAVSLPVSARAPEVEAYIAQRIPHKSASRVRFVRASARIFLETDEHGYIRRRIGTAVRRPPPGWFEPGLDAYVKFLRCARGLADRTVSKRAWQLTQIAECFERNGVRAVVDIQPAQIQQFFTQLVGQKPATRLTYGVTLRSFLRWAYGTGLLPLDLGVAVIAARHFRQAGLRDVLSADEIVRVLDTADRSSAIGRRDLAVLLLAARYGLRPSDIRHLRLDDVHWREGVIAIRQAKTGNPLVLPLLPDVTTALVAYIREGRPTTPAREVFVRHRAPFEPFVPANNLFTIMRAALRGAGFDQRPGRRGLYLFRHTFATRLLAAGCPLKTIGDLMGHVSTATTMSDELLRRQDRLLERRHKQAGFRDPDRSLDSFDFDFNKKMNRVLIHELATGRFVAQREDALFLGPPGTGKSHLAQAIGRAVIQQGYRVLYREAHTLLEEITDATLDGTRKAYLADLAAVPLLIID